MDPLTLRRHLRRLGWHDAARNLPSFLFTKGLPCSRIARGVDIVFRANADNQLEAVLADDGRLIADEHGAYIERDSVQAEVIKTEDMVYVGVRLPAGIDRRLARAAGGRFTKSDLIRRAIRAYLDARGL